MASGAPPPIMGSLAGVAQLVEHHLAKVRVAGSSPVARSEKTNDLLEGHFPPHWIAPTSRGGLQGEGHPSSMNRAKLLVRRLSPTNTLPMRGSSHSSVREQQMCR